MTELFLPSNFGGRIRTRELTQQSCAAQTGGMTLLGQYNAACTVRRLARRKIQIYQCWAKFLRFHHARAGRWIHPTHMGELEVGAFLADLAVNRRAEESTQNQALARSSFGTAMS